MTRLQRGLVQALIGGLVVALAASSAFFGEVPLVVKRHKPAEMVTEQQSPKLFYLGIGALLVIGAGNVFEGLRTYRREKLKGSA